MQKCSPLFPSDDKLSYCVACTEEKCIKYLITNATVCNQLHPFPEDDHGTVCVECFENECLFYEKDKPCEGSGAAGGEAGGAESAAPATSLPQVYHGWSMQCRSCLEEFGTGTMTCDNSGATQCADSHHLNSI